MYYDFSFKKKAPNDLNVYKAKNPSELQGISLQLYNIQNPSDSPTNIQRPLQKGSAESVEHIFSNQYYITD